MTNRATSGDIAKWLNKYAEVIELFKRPRFMMGVMPEFSQRDGRNHFVQNHPVPPYNKDDWPSMSLNQQWALYSEAYTVSKTMLPDLDAALREVEALLFCEAYCTEGGFSLDDVALFSQLRAITIVRWVNGSHLTSFPFPVSVFVGI
jgi:glutaredoxin 2